MLVTNGSTPEFTLTNNNGEIISLLTSSSSSITSSHSSFSSTYSDLTHNNNSTSLLNTDWSAFAQNVPLPYSPVASSSGPNSQSPPLLPLPPLSTHTASALPSPRALHHPESVSTNHDSSHSSPMSPVSATDDSASRGFSIVTNLSRSLDAYRLRMLLALLPRLQSSLPFRIDTPAHNLALLVKAELRYLIWLKLIASIDARGTNDDLAIVPPLDVAFMWLVHLSDTKAYIQDVLRLGGKALLSRSFPLERLHEIVVSLGTSWSDADSERIWHRFAPSEPYRFKYPENMAEGSLPFVCPRCSTTIMIPALHYIRVRFGTETIECSRCQRGGVNIALWSAMLFLNDMRKVAGDASFANFQLKATQMDPHHGLDPNLTFRLNTFLKSIRFDMQLQSKLRISAHRYWGDAYSLLELTLADSPLSAAEQSHLTTSLVNSYGNIVTDLSLDLVERAEHWIRFVSMVETVTGTQNETADLSDESNLDREMIQHFGLNEDWIDQCCDRYFKLLLIQGTLCEQYQARLLKPPRKPHFPAPGSSNQERPSPKLAMPTFDILIAYTTHILSPEQYYAYSLAHFHRVINFHFYSESEMVKAYTRTRRLWKARYKEEYDLSSPSHLGTLLSKHKWRKLLKMTGKVFMVPLSLVVVSTVMLLGGGSSAFHAATAAVVAPANSPGRRETEVTGRFPERRSRLAFTESSESSSLQSSPTTSTSIHS